MVNNVLLAQENMELCTANGKVQQRKRKSTYVQQRGAAGCVQAGNEDSKQKDEDLAQQAFKTFVQSDNNDSVQLADKESLPKVINEPVQKKRAPFCCSLCRTLEHMARSCPRCS